MVLKLQASRAKKLDRKIQQDVETALRGWLPEGQGQLRIRTGCTINWAVAVLTSSERD